MDKIFKFIQKWKIKPILSGVFSLDEIGVVHQMLERGSVTGKIVVSLT
jgi:NADPH:quinone reductase-like Zn-dependent oxidoreductase